MPEAASPAIWSIRRLLVRFAFFAVVIQIPFELQHTFFGLSNLQWTFLLLVACSLPDLLSNWRDLLGDRLIQAATIFVAIQWLAAAFAPEFQSNAFKGAARFTAGLLLVIIARQMGGESQTNRWLQAWAVASTVAAVYALIDYAGFGLPGLFRDQEFYIGQVQRLSGSFEYPNVAATYFAMSLPIVWWNASRPLLRAVFAFLIWCALILTFSKGGLIAVTAITLLLRRKAALTLLATGAVAYAVLIPANPYVMEAIYGPAALRPLALQYKTEWNDLRQRPGGTDVVPVEIRNVGIRTLRSRGLWRFALGYRWWNPQTESFVGGTPLVTELTHDLQPGETMKLDIPFETPLQTGRYLLVVEAFGGDFNWLSRRGVIPALITTDIQLNSTRTVTQSDLSPIYRRGQDDPLLTSEVSRAELWTAAWKTFVAHPFGIGPDNFRLQYGRYLGVARWNTQITTNNQFLEILTGSGVLGLVTFVFVLWMRRWKTDRASVALGVLVTHSLVDSFLMATPIYFAFWLLLGNSGSDV